MGAFGRKFKKRQSLSIGPNLLDLTSNFDKSLLVVFAILTVFGLIMVYSSSFITVDNNPFYYFNRQLIYSILGLFVGFIAYIIDYKILTKFIIPTLVVSIILLILVLIPGIGKEINGATRWIDLKIFDLQPSEVIKPVFIIYLAAWSSKQKTSTRLNKEGIKLHFKENIFPFVMIMGLICSLVLFEPDLATTGIIGVTALSVYFLSGRDYLHNIGAIFILLILIASGLVAGIVAPYRFARIKTFTDFLTTGEVQDPRGSGYQLQNILIAVGSGGTFGVGFGESRQKFHYLGQTAFSDNIFAVIAEEFGLVGSIIISISFLFILFRCLNHAEHIPDKFGQLLMSGLAIWITLQAFMHIAANIGMIPVTGIPMPYISYGGSSIVVTLAAAGMILNLSRHSKLNT